MDERHHDLESPSRDRNDEISQRAYARYLERGGVDGHDMEDWLEAEREVGEANSGHHRLDRHEVPHDPNDMA